MIINPYNVAQAITPSDTDDFPLGICSAIHVGTAGTDADVVAVVLQDGTVVDFTVTAGEILPVAAKRVNDTNTSASNLVALYTR